MGRTLREAGKAEAAAKYFEDVFRAAVKVQGPRGVSVSDALKSYMFTLVLQGKEGEMHELLQRAIELGCDIEVLCGDYDPRNF